MTSPGPDPTAPGPFGQPSYGAQPPYGQAPYGQAPYGQAPYGQAPYGQAPYRQPAYGQQQPASGQQPYGGPPAYGYADPPPAFPQQPYGGPGYPPGAYGPPPTPGVVLIPGVPPMRAASPSQRILGRLIDSVGYLIVLGGGIAGIVAIIANAVDTSYSYGYGYPRASGDGLEILWIYPILAGVWLIVVAYEWLTIGLTGATVGDRVMGVKFVNARTGGPPGVGRSAGRAALLGGSFVFCYGLIFLLLLVSMFFDNQPGRYQGWVDKLCGLQAVSTKG